MRESGKVGIGKVVLRTKQQLCALRPTGDVLTLSTMLFGDEVLAPDRLDELDAIGDAEASDRELKMAEQLIDSLSGEFDPTRYKDEYREQVLDLIERKASGEEIAVQPEAEEPVAAPDLMAALEASLAAVKSDGGGDESAPKSRKKTAAGSENGETSSKQPGQGQELAARASRAAGAVHAPLIRFFGRAPCPRCPSATGVPQ